jgi:endonuclease/exonuclease/phosphatase family metal-dependent hydrolase
MPKRRPRKVGFPLFAVALVVLAALFLYWATRPTDNGQEAAPAGEYLFCFWNVQDLFDDHDDHRGREDREADEWFAHDPEALATKLDHLSDALTKMNGGRGPDIVALAEVESQRAAELLQQALNRRLGDATLHYSHVLMKEVSAGRHIAPAILTRLPIAADRTHLLGGHLRILEGHVRVNDRDLVVIASHWTSRVSDKTGGRRDKYGDQIYGEFRAMVRSNPAVDLLVCGDFNDPPEAASVTENLRAIPDADSVRRSLPENPRLLNLFAGKDPAEFGTHYFDKERRWFIFDQIAVSPGLLDGAGWSCDPASARTVRDLTSDPRGHPAPFHKGHGPEKRGYSDHFPVTVRLRVN